MLFVGLRQRDAAAVDVGSLQLLVGKRQQTGDGCVEVGEWCISHIGKLYTDVFACNAVIEGTQTTAAAAKLGKGSSG